MEKETVKSKLAKLESIDKLMTEKAKHEECISNIRSFIEKQNNDTIYNSKISFGKNTYYEIESIITPSHFEDKYEYAEWFILELENRLKVINKAIERAEKNYMDTINVSVSC